MKKDNTEKLIDKIFRWINPSGTFVREELEKEKLIRKNEYKKSAVLKSFVIKKKVKKS